MIRYIPADRLNEFTKLRDTMFRDRADQFKTRLGWDVSISDQGEERDEYDALNPLYVIWQNRDGTHGGSMRFLPSTGPIMVNDHFAKLLMGRPIRNPKIWECTRYCLARGVEPRVSAALMLGGAEIGMAFDLTFAVGVFDARMMRIYQRLSWPPMVMATSGEGRDAISVGFWSFSDDVINRLSLKSGIARAVSRYWAQQDLSHFSRHIRKSA
ncbi:acyl-homoserine-lactone synthase [Qingshengfaniella alkalisoli]|uniref:Acyl-homoserine-lactone synthase n=1 Tax=Qingshengfaniella alkalisoli TaxID=2599296 RepID=A0A5B8J1P8_9RHOB|nr:acyl-homoserine-lactone synthase [Qingshengfaniella alkalisoli]QDY68407.1 autoinducer synthase [Qingshengfaniella alkalisoli]